jgi:hypothetical protein
MTLETLYNVAGIFKNKAELIIQGYFSGMRIFKNNDLFLEINIDAYKFWIMNKEKWDKAELDKVIEIAKQENIEIKGL